MPAVSLAFTSAQVHRRAPPSAQKAIASHNVFCPEHPPSVDPWSLSPHTLADPLPADQPSAEQLVEASAKA